MKIKVKRLTLSDVNKIEPPKHKAPKKTDFFFRTLLKIVSSGDLKATDFTYETDGELPQKPCLVFMNHSSFIDLEIAVSVFYHRPLSIVCTSDGFVGKEWLMRRLGCIPTRKFTTDVSLISDISYALKKNKNDVLMYPEASYSFDGTATALPRRMGILIKKLGVPVIMIKTEGAFLRDPLYNLLQKRSTKVSAKIYTLFTEESIKTLSVSELDRALDEAFTFDNFRTQREKHIKIDEPFRADGLERILYKCPVCGAEGKTEGKGTELFCLSCGAKWELDEYGRLSGEKFDHIPDWYAWEREEVKNELVSGTYRLDTDVKVLVMADYKAVYDIGEGRLVHTADGFTLTGCGGLLNITQKPTDSYGLYADYFWYELGDVICISGGEKLYYCLTENGVPVAKARLAAEELYKLKKAEKKK